MSNCRNMDGVLELINQKYISLNNQEVKHNNERLQLTLGALISILKGQDKAFDRLFERPYFGGSYFDDLKVGKPDEFDLDLLLVLPKVCQAHKIKKCGCISVVPSNKPGFFWFQVQKGFCEALDKFIKDGYIQTDLVLNWLKSNVTIALNKLQQFDSELFSYAPPTYLTESGPALTIQLYETFGTMDVDLVPAFKFGPDYWPQAGFRTNDTQRTDFFLVPKKPKGMHYSERYWRASFQDQERELIKDRQWLKPALRLLKKMRNNLVQSSVSSYALKTIVLWEVDTNNFNWNNKLSVTFIKLLETYKECLNSKRIAYYWNKNNNLLDGIHTDTLTNHHNEIVRLLKRIKDQHVTNPCIVAKVILKEGSTEYNKFMAECQQRSSEVNELSVRTSNMGTSYYTFDPTVNGDSTFTPAPSTSYNSGRATQQIEEDSSSAWNIAGGVILAIGAVAAVAISISGALNNNNRNQNR